AFTNEEPPHFQTHLMGSWVYAHACKERGDRIEAAVALETMGCFSDELNSQHFPVAALAAAYPSTGNFISFIGDTTCRELIRRSVGVFRETTKFPCEGASLPASIPGVHWSDHWAFVQHQYPALMVTDTAPFRYAHYHTEKDTVDHVDFQRLARVVDGVDRVVEALVK
nr:M28 family peptidase [Planctomycetota bacterium]